MRETLFVVCAQTFAPLAGGLKINYTHLSPRLRQTQRKRNPSEREAESEKKRPTFSRVQLFRHPLFAEMWCSLYCRARQQHKSGREVIISTLFHPRKTDIARGTQSGAARRALKLICAAIFLLTRSKNSTAPAAYNLRTSGAAALCALRRRRLRSGDKAI
jgi:hypothetical protein